MDQELLEEVLNCPSLPSLPAVAVEVIELTRDPDVKLDQLAKTIENDQGLTSKVLRTVNSSYYGLRQKCGTIRQALVVLGLSAVRSLTLGFSLVSAVKTDTEGFDHDDYWRRGLFTGVGARSVAKAAGSPLQDEAFLSGLLQDIGMIAMLEALGARYTAVVDMAAGDHRKVCRFELSELEVQHPDIGAMMAQRWKLPEELVLPVKYHERPTAGPVGELGDLVRAVGLGGILSDAMMSEDRLPHLRRFRSKASDWFGMKPDTIDAIITEVTDGTREMASLFDIDAGRLPDSESLLSEAHNQAVSIAIEAPPSPSDDDDAMDALLADSPRYDAVTGLLNKDAFPKVFGSLFESAVGSGEPVAMLRIVLNRPADQTELRTAEINKLVVSAATLMRKHFEQSGGTVARLGPMSFAAVVTGLNRAGTTRIAEIFRQDFESTSSMWSMPTNVSIGAAIREAAVSSVFDRPALLQQGAIQALKAAMTNPAGCTKVFTPKQAA
ncbi:MAG: HDOD domain-containing protein [Planctomycetota bacterium]